MAKPKKKTRVCRSCLRVVGPDHKHCRIVLRTRSYVYVRGAVVAEP